MAILTYGWDSGSSPSPANAPSSARTYANASTVSLAGPPVSQIASEGEELSVAVEDLKDGLAKFYEYRPRTGPAIKFFALQTAVGIYEVALNGCKCCYLEGQGYVQQGASMVCRKCGESTPIAQIGRIPLAQILQTPGECHPFPIPRTITAEHLVIGKKALEEVSGKAALEEMSRKAGSAVRGQDH